MVTDMSTEDVDTQIYPELNSRIRELRVREEMCYTELVSVIMQELRVTEIGSADRLNGRTLGDLIKPRVLREWGLIAEAVTIGVFEPYRLKEYIEKRLRQVLEQEVTIGYGDLSRSKLNFSINLPAHPIGMRPALRVVRR